MNSFEVANNSVTARPPLLSLLFAIVFACLVSPVAKIEAQEVRKIALLIGVERYEKRGFSNLKFAEDDMQALAALLEQSGFEVAQLSGSADGDRRATKANIEAYLRDQFVPTLADLGKQDIVLVALAGHGRHARTVSEDALSEDHFFCPADAHDTRSETWVSISQLIRTIERESGSERNLVLVDACRDNPSRGRGVDGQGFSTTREAVAVLFAASYSEQAYEPDELEHGIFTYYVLDGLRGKAANFDRAVTWDSMVDYVKGRVERKSRELFAAGAIGGIQRPNSVGNLRGASPVLIARIDDLPRPDAEPRLTGLVLSDSEKEERRARARLILDELFNRWREKKSILARGGLDVAETNQVKNEIAFLAADLSTMFAMLGETERALELAGPPTREPAWEGDTNLVNDLHFIALGLLSNPKYGKTDAAARIYQESNEQLPFGSGRARELYLLARNYTVAGEEIKFEEVRRYATVRGGIDYLAIQVYGNPMSVSFTEQQMNELLSLNTHATNQLQSAALRRDVQDVVRSEEFSWSHAPYAVIPFALNGDHDGLRSLLGSFDTNYRIPARAIAAIRFLDANDSASAKQMAAKLLSEWRSLSSVDRDKAVAGGCSIGSGNYPSPLSLSARCTQSIESYAGYSRPFGTEELQYLFGRLGDETSARAVGDGQLSAGFAMGLLVDCTQGQSR